MTTTEAESQLTEVPQAKPLVEAASTETSDPAVESQSSATEKPLMKVEKVRDSLAGQLQEGKLEGMRLPNDLDAGEDFDKKKFKEEELKEFSLEEKRGILYLQETLRNVSIVNLLHAHKDEDFAKYLIDIMTYSGDQPDYIQTTYTDKMLMESMDKAFPGFSQLTAAEKNDFLQSWKDYGNILSVYGNAAAEAWNREKNGEPAEQGGETKDTFKYMRKEARVFHALQFAAAHGVRIATEDQLNAELSSVDVQEDDETEKDEASETEVLTIRKQLAELKKAIAKYRDQADQLGQLVSSASEIAMVGPEGLMAIVDGLFGDGFKYESSHLEGNNGSFSSEMADKIDNYWKNDKEKGQLFFELAAKQLGRADLQGEEAFKYVVGQYQSAPTDVQMRLREVGALYPSLVPDDFDVGLLDLRSENIKFVDKLKINLYEHASSATETPAPAAPAAPEAPPPAEQK